MVRRADDGVSTIQARGFKKIRGGVGFGFWADFRVSFSVRGWLRPEFRDFFFEIWVDLGDPTKKEN